MKKNFTLVPKDKRTRIATLISFCCLLTIATKAKDYKLPANSAPVAYSETKTVLEDKTLSGTVKATDADGNRLNYHLLTTVTAQQGTLTFDRKTGNYVYTPAPNFYGTAKFTFNADDKRKLSNTATVTINVTPVNDAPSFTKGTNQTTTEDAAAKTILAWATGIKAGPSNESTQALSFVVTNSNNSLFSVQPAINAAGTLTYTPARNANGTATVSVKLTDDGGTTNGGVNTSAVQTFTITITPVNDAPVASSISITTPESTAKTGQVSATDVDNAATAITYSLVTGPTHGTLTLSTTGSFTYTPAANYNGSDAFTYRVYDGSSYSNTATVSITVTAVNSAPVAANSSLTTLEDARKVGVVSATDADNDAVSLTYSVVAAPTHGTLALNTTGSYTYTPAANYNGSDAFTYHASDGISFSNTATVSITVTAVNDAPSFTKGANQTVAEDAAAQTIAGWATAINPGATNESTQTLSFGVTNNNNSLFSVQPAISAAGVLTYTPATNANGVATVSVKLTDNGGTANGGINSSAIQTFTITITAVNDAPVAQNASVSTPENTPKTDKVVATDVDNAAAAITYSVVTSPAHGTLTLGSTGSYTYTPAANYSGNDAFTYKAYDGAVYSNTATVTISVALVNSAPVAANSSLTTTEDTQKTGTVSATDANNDAASLTYSVVTTPVHGTLVLNTTGSYTYTPGANYNGTDAFTFRASDGTAFSNTATVSITVTAVNDAPSFTKGANQTIAEDAAAQSVAGWATAISAGPSDESAQTLSFVVTNTNNALFAVQPAVSAAGTLTYTLAANANGSATVSVKLTDNGGTTNGGVNASAVQTFSITVTAVNDAPVAQNANFSTTQGAQKAGTVTATDIDNVSTSLTYKLVSSVTHGSLIFNSNGSYTYTAATDFSGSDAFTFTASDGTATSNTAKVSITIATPPPPATIQINFQDSATKTPTGWLADFGQAFGARTLANQGSGNTYGWIKRSDNTPVNLTAYGRKRTSPADTLLATLMQMQYSTAPEGVWQMQVPNGAYEVTLSVGDGQYVDSKHFVNVEGIAAIVNFVPTSTVRFKTATVTVNVSDRLLTIDAIGGANTKINYVIIKPVSGTALVKTIQFAQTSHSVDVEEGGTKGVGEYISTSDASPVSVQLNATDGQKAVPNWLTVNGKVINGIAYTAGSEITFTVDASNLSIGKYTARVTAAASSYQSAFVDFTLNVTAGTDGVPAQLKVNFQDSATKTPAGWLRDYGQAFGQRSSANQGTGNTFGWIKRSDNTPLDLTKNGRFRTSPADTLLATFIHMQGNNISNFSGTAIEGIWEAQVANGNYDVTVSVGDGTQIDSKHTINVEGVPAILNFVPTTTTRFKSATVSVTVADGLLTVDAIGGTNTKINYISIQPSTSRRPSVVQVNPENGSQNVSDIASISTSVLNLPNGGINNATLNSTTVYLEEEATKTRVPANVNGTGGGDAITLVPQSPLKLSTSYVFYITDGVKDLSGASFIPYASSFTTGSIATGTVQNVKFQKVTLPNATGQHSSLTIGPDGKLYALGIDGVIKRFIINPDGTLQGPELLYSLQDAYGTRQQTLAIGFAFAPGSTATNLVAYVTHSTYTFLNGPDWDGKLTKLSGANLQTAQDILIHLPRSAKDHVTNSIAFGPDGALYFTQGSTTAMGDSDRVWSEREEHLLSAAVLRLDLTKLGTTLPLDVKTKEGGGTYDPYATSAPLTLYATGVRNAYDLVWHSNGELYTATNGSASGGNTPPSVPGTLRPDGTTYNGPVVPGLKNVTQTQRDFLYRIKKGGYYGHPNPQRGQYVMNGGNPTASVDPGQVNAYPVGTMPDPNWRGFAFDFQTNKSPNGSIEYKSNTFGGALKGKLMIVRYSQNDDIITLTPGGANNDIVNSSEGATIPGLSGFVDPLDLTEDTKTGNLYVSEYGGSGKITLLRVDTSSTTTTTTAVTTASAPATMRNSSVDSSSAGRIALRELTEETAFEKTKVYPNPFHQKFTLVFPTVYSGNITLQIVDMAGRVYQIGKSNLRAGGNVMDVDLSKFNLKAGAYLLKIKSESRNETIKLLIQ